MSSRSMTKGTVYLIIAQVVFMVSGYAIHFGLARLLGPALYGVYGVVISLISIVNILLTSGAFQAVAKHISAGDDQEIVKRVALKLQFAFSIIVFVVYELLADFFALILGDTSIVLFIRISGFIMIGYALYSVFIGYFNGLREFKKQAGLQIVYSLSKMIFMIGFVFIGFSLYGALIGFALAPFLVFFIGVMLTGVGKNDQYDWKRLAKFAWPVIIFSVASSFLVSIDLFSVKAIIGENVQTGFYNAATTLARIPYSILGAIGFALFPSISYVFAKNDMVSVKRYGKESVRYLLIFLLPITFLFSSTSGELAKFLYGSEYAIAGNPLGLLVFGFAFLTVFSLLATTIIASGKPKVAMIYTIIMVCGAYVFNRLLIPIYDLNGAAIANSIAMFIGMLLAFVFVTKNFGSFFEITSLIRIIGASLIIYYICKIFVLSGGLLIIQYLLTMLLYFGILISIREINKRDIERLRQLLPAKISF